MIQLNLLTTLRLGTSHKLEAETAPVMMTGMTAASRFGCFGKRKFEGIK